METIGSPGLWAAFAAVVIAALLVDLVLMRHGGPHKLVEHLVCIVLGLQRPGHLAELLRKFILPGGCALVFLRRLASAAAILFLGHSASLVRPLKRMKAGRSNSGQTMP